MFVKQIDFVEAMNRAAKGDDVMILVPGPNGWDEYRPSTLHRMLDGCVFFRRVPAQDNPEFEAAVHEMEHTEQGEDTPPTLMEVLQNLPEAPRNRPASVWIPVPRGRL